MLTLVQAVTLGGGGDGIASLETADISGGTVLQGYSLTGDIRGTWGLNGGGATPTGSYDPGDVFAISDADLTLAGDTYGLTDDQLARIAEAGQLTVALDQNDFSRFRVESLWIDRGPDNWLFVEAPSGGLVRFDIADSAFGGGGTLSLAPAANFAAPDLDDLLHVARGGDDYLIGLSANDNSITAWQVDDAGTLSEVARAPDGIGIAAPSAAVQVEIDGRTYLVVAGTGSGSLSVLELTPSGGLDLVDHVLDDATTTRFRNATVLEAVELGGRTYIVASGTDQGLSVLTLLPGGRLLHLASLGDTADITLDAVSALAMAASGTDIRIFAASGTESGVTQLTFSAGPAGETWAGTAVAETRTGGAANDILMGGGGNDDLDGGAGDDVLSDGTGTDTLRGGSGADLFVFTNDDTLDVLLDYDPQQDRLDLSDFPMLYSLAQVQITPTPNGARLIYRDEEIDIRSADGMPLDSADFSTASIIDLDRPPRGVFTARLRIDGTDDADQLISTQANTQLMGKGGNDILISLSGDNLLNGGNGSDWADYSAAAVGISGSLETGEITIGTGWVDLLVEIEHLVGSALDDTIAGHAGANTLLGAAGADDLSGAGGDDELRGGTGADTLRGGSGADTLYGNTSVDVLFGDAGNDELRGGDGVDQLFGGDDDDYLIGHKGWDSLDGGAGNDELRGSSGADSLDGGTGNDSLHGGTGVDTLRGGGDDDILYGNQGADTMFGEAGNDELFGGSGVDALNGGADNDTLWGNEGADVQSGGGGDDELFGGTGDDSLAGDAGNDTLWGGQGVDTLAGGAGDDWLRGGTLADTFVYTEGADTIDDLAPAEDRLQLDDSLWTGTLSASDIVALFGQTQGADYVLDFANGNTLTLNGGIDSALLVGLIDIV